MNKRWQAEVRQEQHLAFLADDPATMFLGYAPYELLSATWLGAALAVTHSMVGLRQRAVASAVLFFLINLIGLGLGPQLLPLISDYVFRDEMQIHMSMLVVTVSAEALAALIRTCVESPNSPTPERTGVIVSKWCKRLQL